MDKLSLQNFASMFETECIEESIRVYVELIRNQILQKAYLDSPNKIVIPQQYRGQISADNELCGTYISRMNSQSPKFGLILPLPFRDMVEKMNTFNRVYANITPINGAYVGKTYQDEIIKRLQSLFPDTKFIIDPLNTYLFVDWS